MRTTILVTLVFVVFAQHAFAQAVDSVSVGEPELRAELLQMVEADQAARQVLIEKGFANLDSLDVARINEVDSTNRERLKEIIQVYGWPTGALVGKDGVSAAFLIVQHADLDRTFQKRMLPYIEASFRAGDLQGEAVALLTDRILTGEGKPQRYGTQVRVEDGRAIVMPLEDSTRVDEWRAEMGLPPLAEYLEVLKELYRLEK